jgi:DNA topoisomerase VI subunit A
MKQAPSSYQSLTASRDLYYRHPDLFVKQSVVDRYVDDIACTFGVSRAQLNVVRSCLCSVHARANRNA